MALTKAQVKQLRGLANTLNPALWVGKAGITAGTEEQAEQTLEARELVKFAVQSGSPIDASEASKQLADLVGAEVVQVIGHRFVLYRRTSKDGADRITLVK